MTTTELNDKSKTKAGGLEEHKATGKSNLSLKFCAFVGTIPSDDEPALEVGARGWGWVRWRHRLQQLISTGFILLR